MRKGFKTFYLIAVLLTAPVAAALGESETQRTGSIQGIVINAQTGMPVSWTSIVIEDLNRSAQSHENGEFIFRNIPVGQHELKTFRLGYETTVQNVEVSLNDTVYVTLEMRETIFRGSDIEILGRADDPTTEPEIVISGRQLRQQLGRTISETMANEPGLSQQSMGPAPARPVLRGLGGDRLLILEDGRRTGDLSATAADHAVAIDPMTAGQIELIRGPSALVYGSNTQGGVINVVRGQIPSSVPDHFHGSTSFQNETVNRGYSGGLNITGPLGNFAFRADGSARTAGNIRTPNGQLDNTGINSYNGSLGLSYIRTWGKIGASGNIFESSYGIPGGFLGGHASGVNIDMLRRYMEFKAKYIVDNSWFRRLDFESNYSYYHHVEYERDDIIGSEFGVLTTNFRANAHHRGFGPVKRGLVGIWAEHRDYKSGGRSFTPGTIETALAAYAYEEAEFNRLRLQGSLRYDMRTITPDRDVMLEIGPISTRSFNNFSASLSATWRLAAGWQAGSMIMRSYRTPGTEELFSGGPHLAAFSYEVGNPDLDEETGLGAELFVRYRGDRIRFNTTVFRNRFNGYIFPENTGQTPLRFDDLLVYQYRGARVLMTGFEGNAEVKLIGNIVAAARLGYVRGDIIGDENSIPFWTSSDRHEPLPMIPPVNGKFDLEYRRSDLTIGTSTRMAAVQNRTNEFEEPTSGYQVYDLYGQYFFNTGNTLHTLALNLENITNREYRNHLSRVKSIMPEPGINIKLLYRMYF